MMMQQVSLLPAIIMPRKQINEIEEKGLSTETIILVYNPLSELTTNPPSNPLVRHSKLIFACDAYCLLPS